MAKEEKNKKVSDTPDTQESSSVKNDAATKSTDASKGGHSTADVQDKQSDQKNEKSEEQKESSSQKKGADQKNTTKKSSPQKHDTHAHTKECDRMSLADGIVVRIAILAILGITALFFYQKIGENQKISRLEEYIDRQAEEIRALRQSQNAVVSGESVEGAESVVTDESRGMLGVADGSPQAYANQQFGLQMTFPPALKDVIVVQEGAVQSQEPSVPVYHAQFGQTPEDFTVKNEFAVGNVLEVYIYDLSQCASAATLNAKNFCTRAQALAPGGVWQPFDLISTNESMSRWFHVGERLVQLHKSGTTEQEKRTLIDTIDVVLE